ncbi:MAG: hypothetical protein KGJ32_04815 [Xanthomonadaceae bacterium]|nr:hypothetical protein [Xanthomonadaceae bacterium]
MGLIALIARLTGVEFVLFPELGALSHDILKRPHGTWARSPIMLVATPVATALVGTLITRHLAYGALPVLLDIGASVLMIFVSRSPIAPAISAGLLPLTMGYRSWWYPPSIVLGTGLLAVISVVVRRWSVQSQSPSPASPDSVRDRVDDTMEIAPFYLGWVSPFLVLLVMLAGIAQWTGMRFVLFPPLVVIAFEMFAHPRVCPWARRVWHLPLACTASAALGVLLVALFGVGIAGTMLSMLGSVLILRALDLHAPPALAVGLLPMIIPHPDYRFVVAVLTGTIMLVGVFVCWRRIAK